MTRLKLGMHMGRKTYVTLKVYQSIPKSLMMLVTSHQTEQQLNEYPSIKEDKRLASHQETYVDAN